jgi:hypothetical protein
LAKVALGIGVLVVGVGGSVSAGVDAVPFLGALFYNPLVVPPDRGQRLTFFVAASFFFGAALFAVDGVGGAGCCAGDDGCVRC